ncbi:5-methyltetrahydropteroyltriglutamate--homocysteine methyltransferase [Corynebacterium occultum]|uniref:5-methyltetrahydropteroyltriglutamate--homocysteine S-methyltransferase n=1 Tax=Corynebacterium occultum TaxID=2675219 RepID=A0A6B8W3L3_9CORY|nr:5-methyltetrahydropteroyltriglutamate--homocysteine S-methyltransferase [Corynebacterium occultum]QGU05995.1 5-methyltetrahydropteroyltriglutamate--homocysteine methyltransferase [Corynebacterium occultum]
MTAIKHVPFPNATIEGYPRVGPNRELKKALESFWKGRIDTEAFRSAAHSLRINNWGRLAELGLKEDYAIPADAALYDHVLETAVTVGLLGGDHAEVELDEFFTLARGNAERAPLEMTKWFDTNYHYLVPEVGDDEDYLARPQRLLDLFNEAAEAGQKVRPFLVGPVTLLALSKQAEGATTQPLDHLPALTKVYAEILKSLAEAGIEWVQIEEPALVADLGVASDEELAQLARQTYTTLLAEDAARPAVFLSAPYGSLNAGLQALADVRPEALGVDLAPQTLKDAPDYVERIIGAVQPGTRIVAGVVDGRNIWAADLRERLSVLEQISNADHEVSVSSSVSLLHVPHTVAVETKLPVDVAGWLSFADEKVGEVAALNTALRQGTTAVGEAFARSDRAVRTRNESARTHNEAVQARVANLPNGQVTRQPAYPERVEAQKVLNLPKLPTTTIGSFPQTAEIRKARADHRDGVLNDAQYTEALKDEVKSVIELQERLGIDVLVHGEPERNDMVQYFAELLDGFIVTENGWVQSYGSRCTRPPVVVGDVSRPKAMTVEWARYAQSLSEKHVKGMLTGPVTILAWSFVRDDVPLSVSADQIGVALADEVRDLEEAGIKIIQIDEPALRELLPLRAENRRSYLDWAVRSFRLVAAEAQPETQIHTHLCYSEFGQIIEAINDLDADVTSIEAARSRMELLGDIEEKFTSGIGPGIYDIHSPRVPEVAELVELLTAAAKHVPAERLWVNPDCGLKTRGYEETEASLRNMVIARDHVVENVPLKETVRN